MEVYIKYDNPNGYKSNYTRFGKIIPTEEKKIDLEKFFGKKDVGFVYKQLKADKNIKITAVKTAGETVRKKIEELDKEVNQDYINRHGREDLTERVRSQRRKDVV